jgi:amino acid adenylation domain-containing protein
MTYGDLNARANRLAAWLRDNGIGPGALVGLYFDRSFSLLVGLLAILKAGGAYLPLDLACPADRLLFEVKDAETPLILTDRVRAERLKGFGGGIACLDEMEQTLAAYSAENLPPRAKPDDLAYVIYTSGSTGAPKGVAVTQENVRRLFTTTDELFHFGPADVWTLFHSSAFDFSVWEIFGALLYGGRLVIVPYTISRSAVEFRDLLVREKVTVLNQTPSAFRQLVQADRDLAPMPKALRYVIFGGEALEFETLRPWFDRYGDEQPRCVNMYGITETTVHVTHHRVTRADLDQRGSNIGRPIPDLRVYLADEQGRLVAKGEPGEMIVGGPGVARGYLRRPELTAQRFIDDRYGNSGTKLYRSGDLAREREDGNLEYLGRIDQQVKIRGFRIELGEIEAVLLRHEGVESCAVVARAEPDAESRLAAYYVVRNPAPTVAELREHLAASLPDYMVPAFLVAVPSLPLTLNGKLDRAALPDPAATRPALVSDFAAPEAEMEKLVAREWRAVLRQESVGVNDNFFDLGGDSLLLTALHRRLQAELGRDFSITDLFQYPTIRAFAAHLANEPESDLSAKQNESRAQKQRAAFQRARDAVNLRTAP